MPVLGDRIRALRKDNKLTQEQLGKALGVGKSTISQYETGVSTPDPAMLQSIADYFCVSSDYLLGRTEDPRPVDMVKEQQAEHLVRILGEQLVEPGELVPVPILGRIAAGEPMYAEENVEGVEMTPKADVSGGEYFWLRVKGDSMINEGIRDGSLVLVRKQETIENGLIGAVIVNGCEATLKRIHINGDQCILVPGNPRYRPQVYHASEVTIVGEAIKVTHNLNGR